MPQRIIVMHMFSKLWLLKHFTQLVILFRRSHIINPGIVSYTTWVLEYKINLHLKQCTFTYVHVELQLTFHCYNCVESTQYGRLEICLYYDVCKTVRLCTCRLGITLEKTSHTTNLRVMVRVRVRIRVRVRVRVWSILKLLRRLHTKKYLYSNSWPIQEIYSKKIAFTHDKIWHKNFWEGEFKVPIDSCIKTWQI